MQAVELRCDQNPSRLFAKWMTEGGEVTKDNLIEVSCRDCRKKLGAKQVRHRFDAAGQLVETVIDDGETTA